MAKSSELTIRDRVKLLVVTKFGARVFSRRELLEAWREEHPDIPESGVLPADYCVNTKTGQWTPLEERFLFCVVKGKYRIYDPSCNGRWTISERGAGLAQPAAGSGATLLVIDRDFVRRWSNNYDKQFQGSYDQSEEKAIRDWLSKQVEPKYLNKEYFVRLGRWKTKRQTSNYEANDESKIIEVTRSAYQASDERIRLNILRTLKGVGVAVAATILHYLEPNLFPIFDYHARTTLKKAGLWTRKKDDASEQAWLEYVEIMRELSNRLGVSLRDLDKALFAYDKYGDKYQQDFSDQAA